MDEQQNDTQGGGQQRAAPDGLLTVLGKAEGAGKIDPETAAKLRAAMARVFYWIGKQVLGAFAVPLEPIQDGHEPLPLTYEADRLFARLDVAAERVRALEQAVRVWGHWHHELASPEAVARELQRRN